MLYVPHVRGVKARVDSSFVALLIVDVRRVCDASAPVLTKVLSLEVLQLWYDSETHQPLDQLLHEATDCDMVFVDGLET